MTDFPEKINEFLRIAGIENPQSIDLKDCLYFTHILRAKNGKNPKLLTYIKHNPEILTLKIKEHFVFDYFFEKVVQFRDGVDAYKFWIETIEDVLVLLDDQDNSDDIKYDKAYICKLQSSMKSHTFLFDILINKHGFNIGEPEFLIYSVIVRGELDKLKIINDICPIEKYKGIFSAALRYGRYTILSYFINDLKLNIDEYGRVLNFNNYHENIRHVYYTVSIGYMSSDYDNPKIYDSKQNYVESIKLIVNTDYDYPINKSTIFSWVEKMDNINFKWDNIEFSEIMDILRPSITEKIPLTCDFGPYNEYVFGKEWSDRASIIEYCKHLETELEEVKEKYEDLRVKYYDTIEVCDDEL